MGKIINRVGEIHNNLKIIEELGGRKITCICINCSEQEIYSKDQVINKKALCKKCGIKNVGLVDRAGQTFRELQITEELHGGKVKCRCIRCGHIDIYNKGRVVKLRATCKNCYTAFNDKTGEVHKDLKIIKELGGREVSCKCLKCGRIYNYSKETINRESADCVYCGLRFKYKGKIINAVKIIDFAYTGRNGHK